LELEEEPAASVAVPVFVDEQEPQRQATSARNKRKPVVPAWEDVLLGVRSSGDR
jgi:hypothetical protein